MSMQCDIEAKTSNTVWGKFLPGVSPQRIVFCMAAVCDYVQNAALNVGHLAAREILMRFQRRGLKTIREVEGSLRRKD